MRNREVLSGGYAAVSFFMSHPGKMRTAAGTEYHPWFRVTGMDTEDKRVTERESVSKGDTFSVGDLVRLKSGGPSMTIEEMECAANDSGPATYFGICVWYSSDGKTLRATFAESMLESVEP